MMKHFPRYVAVKVAVCLLVGMTTQWVWAAPPNVVVILADDMGFSDLGCYGSEIETPNFDRLAHGGLRFTQGYNTARCWPTRGALLTGYYAQSIRRDKMPGVQGGRRGGRPAWAQLLPERLAAAGYRSYHSGKWHVDGNPLEQGFAHSLDIQGGQNDFFDPAGITVDGKTVKEKDDFYVTTAVGEHAAACLREHAEHHGDKPFFSYVAFTSPHFPLHAPQDIIEKYKTRYQAGWNVIQQARYKRLVQSGIITTPLAPMEEDLGPPYDFPDALEKLGPGEINRPLPWQSLTPEQQTFQATKMAIHAAMIDAMDQAVGEVIQQLEAMNAMEDTLILCLSDNGGSAEIMVRGRGHDPVLPAGSAGTYLCLGPGWSSCANTPFRRHKSWVHEGGIATSWIVHWPQGIASKSALREQPVHVIDIVPTVLELAGIDHPKKHGEKASPPLQGRSFVQCLTNPTAPPPHETLWWCHDGHRAVRHNDWKLVAARNEPWELYDLSSDRTEQNNLVLSHPEHVKQLEEDWNQIATENQKLANLDGKNQPPVNKKKRKSSPKKSVQKKQLTSEADQRKDAQKDRSHRSPPNVVIVFTDDMGYADPACYGGTFAATPHIDRLAREGIKLTDFHVAQPVCSASRAALLTGCYPNRLGIHGALSPKSMHGLSADETTLAELLRSRGYRTSMVGKWHLGHHRPFLPTRHGFDEYFGLPYSNDMWPYHPQAKPGTYPPLPLFENQEVIDKEVTPEDQMTLTKRYAQRAVDFLKRAGTAKDGRPFFLYLAHSMPHVPLFASKGFQGKAAGGLYGDVVAEIDASVGSVLTALEETGHLDDTLVLFTSDNGPWLSYGNHAGSAGSFREGKGTTFEGGVRVPCVARLPGVIPAGTVSDEALMTIDILPSIAQLTGKPLKTDAEGHCILRGKKIDGHDHLNLFCGGTRAADAPDTYHFYYRKNELQAVRKGDWKLFLPHSYRTMQGQELGRDGKPGKYTQHKIGKVLFNLSTDPHETKDVAKQYPKVVEQLQAIAEKARVDLGDSLLKRKGIGTRPPGQLSNENDSKANQSKSAGKQKTIPLYLVSHTPKLSERRPNIIYVMTDDQGYGDIASHGNLVLKTPFLDRMRKQSVCLTEYHVSPTCAPTRAALMTGRHEFHSGVTHTIRERERMALSQTTLPELLRTAGYTTGIFGKWHLGDEDAYQPGSRGFDRVFIHGGGGIGQSFSGSCGDAPGNTYFAPMIRSDGRFIQTRGYCTDIFFREAETWITKCKEKDIPFFCYLSTNAPHGPLIPPATGDEYYRTALQEAGLKKPKQIDRVAPFYAMVENIDTNMGRLLRTIDSLGLAENTLIVFSTDNGSGAGSSFYNAEMHGAKNSPYRGGTRVPAFWKWKGVLPEGVDVSQVTAHIDVLPTLCELAGVQIPQTVADKIEGRSLVPLLKNQKADWPDRPLVTHQGRWDRGKAAENKYKNCRIREGRWSLVNTKNKPDGWELYDINSDPSEKTNVASKHPDVVRRLASSYTTWWESVQPDLVNEDVDGPSENPFKTAYWKQYGPQPTHEDVSYGKHPKQKLHFWKASSATAEHPAPLLFFIHGGGWSGGNRFSGLSQNLKPALESGISVASIEYRFVDEAEGVEPPVKAPLTDAARALQFVRSKAAAWHLDTNRIVAAGGSAGACTSLWLAFHDEMADPTSDDPIAHESTRLTAVAVSGAQTTLDPKQMKEWTPNSHYGGHAFGIPTIASEGDRRSGRFTRFLESRESLLPWIQEYSPYALVTADDPPVYMFYNNKPALGHDAKDPTHSANFGVKLKEHLDSVKVPSELVYPDAPNVQHATMTEAVIDFLVP